MTNIHLQEGNWPNPIFKGPHKWIQTYGYSKILKRNRTGISKEQQEDKFPDPI